MGRVCLHLQRGKHVQHVTAYGATAIVFFALDFLWLGTIAKSFYAREMESLLRDSPNMTVAALFYLVYVVGVVFFAVQPALQAQSWKMALAYGALLGLIAYGTYDMTNLATLRGWSTTVAVVDLIWGTCLTAVAAAAGYLAVRAVG